MAEINLKIKIKTTTCTSTSTLALRESSLYKEKKTVEMEDEQGRK